MRAGVRYGVVLAILGLGSACTVTSGRYIPSSRFTYPNSNVVSLGNVTGESARWSIITAATIDGTVAQEAIRQALRQKGGQMLINFTMTTTTTTIPTPFFIPIYRTSFRVEGMACSMDVGIQKLDPVGKGARP